MGVVVKVGRLIEKGKVGKEHCIWSEYRCRRQKHEIEKSREERRGEERKKEEKRYIKCLSLQTVFTER
jgi:hypothetical protein